MEAGVAGATANKPAAGAGTSGGRDSGTCTSQLSSRECAPPCSIVNRATLGIHPADDWGLLLYKVWARVGAGQGKRSSTSATGYTSATEAQMRSRRGNGT